MSLLPNASRSPMYPCVFLDRDGVLIEDTGYPFKVSEMKFVPLLSDSLRKLNQHGFKLIVISNQSGLARGIFKPEELDVFNYHLRDYLWENAVEIDAFYSCPYHLGGNVEIYDSDSEDRKPGIGLLKKAMHDFPEIDIAKSFFIGDRESDILCAKAFGLKPIFIENLTHKLSFDHPTIFKNLSSAVEFIVKKEM